MSLCTEGHPTTDDLRRSYDGIPYPDVAKPFTHISRLAAIGNLHGLTPVTPASCQVLDLGCADGGNLLPMALRFPRSQFTGIDLSSRQIEIGRGHASAAAASNLNLRVADILDLGSADLGCYDYIIVHGVYSWVPAPVQEKILSICRDHLNADGLAYVSYNTYPGWRAKQALREMLRYHTQRIDAPRAKAEAALTFLGALPTATDLPGDPAAIVADRVRHDLESVEDPVTYLVHEYLIDANQPLYVSDFLSRVAAKGLQYVDDAFPGSTAPERLPPAAQQLVREASGDTCGQQQYIDFMANVSFRRSLLCHARLQLRRDVPLDRLRPLYAAATCSRRDPIDGTPTFRTDPGQVFSVQHEGLRGILDRLVEARPTSVPVLHLLDILGGDVTDGEAAAMLSGLLHSAALEFTSHPFHCTTHAGERPCASNLARYQAASGLVTNAVHRPVRIQDPVEQHLLPLLDGTCRMPELVALLQKRLTPGKPLSEAEWHALVEDRLAHLARQGLLIPPAEANPPSCPSPTPG